MNTTWPKGLVRLLDGDDLGEKVGFTMQLLTVGPGGWPHVALLGVGEVLIVDPDTVRFALWQTTTTSGNVARYRQAVLGFVHDEAWCLARLEVEGVELLDHLPTPLLGVQARLVDLRQDRAPYARLTGALTFELHEPASVLPRWRATVEALLAAPTLNRLGDQRS
ncbi:MAG: pyridoxamine 5'-phosphate oxidase family protein [Acidimicrobiia bacterium]|nr:pyridoxamine 5'-phosphate oxidase family protein [Acidimicrobiia bacterium]